MTPEEKIKAYDEAIKRAKEIIGDPNASSIWKDWLKNTFLELAESENDRIKEEIKVILANTDFSRFALDYTFADMINWLEKKGEQSINDTNEEIVKAVKDTSILDKVEPKFKVGDWITDGQLTCKVLSVTSKSYELHLYNDDYCHFETDVQSVDKDYHLWTIEDAKDGDVLCVKYGNDEMPFIFTGKQDDVAYCALNSFGEFVLSIAEWLLKTSVLPSTKEQRDTLFTKMREAGYEWDAEKKELKKIESKLHKGEWIISNNGDCVGQIIDYGGDNFFWCEHTNGYFSGYFKKDYHLWTIQDAKDGDVLVNGSNIFIFHFLNDTRLMGYCHVNTNDGRFYNDIGKNECFCLIDAVVTPATKEQRGLLFSKMKEAGFEWDAEKKELKEIEQEDEEYNGDDYGIDSLYHAQRILEKTLGEVEGYQSDDGILEHKCAITAVKGLYKKKPAEWSEEDEKILVDCFNILHRSDYSRDKVSKIVNWLRSIKQRIGE